ncbi:hypothetical protein D5S18_11025 [Nocardia panacis]|uniref:Uncharacterized protein n=1 Tax=Nocardia panacis TaxID=2340916 RepID=A0A3A4KMJ8_9NOCA|nr:hypothetical protein [Nocardia panacis]RJO76778.1 hypothetical protein D5S18_11025 [Nocardia panacis]
MATTKRRNGTEGTLYFTAHFVGADGQYRPVLSPLSGKLERYPTEAAAQKSADSAEREIYYEHISDMGVQVGITIVVQDMNHGRMESISGAPAQTLFELVLDTSLGSMTRGIHMYADTMFNSYQLKFFLDELETMKARNERGEELFSVLRRAAQSAIDKHGYLWFIGD